MSTRVGRRGGWWTKRPAPRMAFNGEGLPGVMGDVWTRVYAGISLVFQWCLSIKVPLSSVRLIPVWKMPAGRCVSTTEASQAIRKTKERAFWVIAATLCTNTIDV